MTDLGLRERIEGPNLVLRLIRPIDAGRVHALRVDSAYNHHLSAVRGTAEDQRPWIETYKARKADLSEFYYAIERKDGTCCGLVRLHVIGAECTWGRYILSREKTWSLRWRVRCCLLRGSPTKTLGSLVPQGFPSCLKYWRMAEIDPDPIDFRCFRNAPIPPVIRRERSLSRASRRDHQSASSAGAIVGVDTLVTLRRSL